MQSTSVIRSLLIALLLALCSRAHAQGTAPPAGEPPPDPVPTAANNTSAGNTSAGDEKSRLDELYKGFQQLKDRLPFKLGAGLWLLYWQPVDSKATLANGSSDGVFQLYSFYLTLDKEINGFGAHTEFRLRDAGHTPGTSLNPYQRDFFTSNVWFQEVYVYYTPVSLFKLKAGKIYRQMGLFWDGSFFGNLEYFDGLKLNPDWGVSVEGQKVSASGKVGFRYWAQFFVHSDGIDGAFTTGRQALMSSPESALPAEQRALVTPNSEAQGTNTRNVVNGRLELTLAPKPWALIDVGVSGLYGQRQWDDLPNSLAFKQVSTDLTLRLGPITLLGEYMRQWGPAVRNADYLIGGASLTVKRVTLRLNTSYAHYYLPARDIEEFMIQPGITLHIGWGLSLIAEYDEWRACNPYQAPGGLLAGEMLPPWKVFDRSLNLVIGYVY